MHARATAELAREAESIAGGIMSFDGVGSWANLAVGLGLDGPVEADELDRLVRFYADRGVEPRIEICPFVDESLLRGLADRGFTVRDFENLLVRDLRGGALPQADGGPDRLEIARVDPSNEAQVRTFIDVSTSGFRPEGEALAEPLLSLTRGMVSSPSNRCFLALYEGEPAGGGAVGVSGSIGALFGTSVLPRYRRRGIQRALILRRLQQARDEGCTHAVIASKPGIATERNATRVGFFLAYTKVLLALRREGLVPSP
ncbi:acetyltransferase, GNAT family [Vulgatibacter incomptus]|uniref:Acetyltransferase, GNAT family n=1 Tax=Vulgatibacter incomptus TaxID=1391653 RepID=A0A0K1PBR7_9BACT|nr:acetyltransferase, GNAT family [Vulgatibacter incomptus]